MKANGRHFQHLLWLSWLVFECFVSVFVLTLTWLYHPILVFITVNVRLVACVTRYSRGTENRCGGKYNTCFITTVLRCITAKNYPNRPRIDNVIAKIKSVQFFLKHSVKLLKNESHYAHTAITLGYWSNTSSGTAFNCTTQLHYWKQNEIALRTLTLVLFCLTPSTICSNCFKNCSRPLDDAIALTTDKTNWLEWHDSFNNDLIC